MSWLFITLLNFLHCIYGANYPVTAVVFSLLGAGALNHPAAPNEPPLWKKPTDLNFNRNSISAKKVHSKPGLNEGCGHVWSRVPHVSKCHVVSNTPQEPLFILKSSLQFFCTVFVFLDFCSLFILSVLQVLPIVFR